MSSAFINFYKKKCFFNGLSISKLAECRSTRWSAAGIFRWHLRDHLKFQNNSLLKKASVVTCGLLEAVIMCKIKTQFKLFRRILMTSCRALKCLAWHLRDRNLRDRNLRDRQVLLELNQMFLKQHGMSWLL